MADFHKFDISDGALQQARDLGMFGNVRGSLERMARLAAPFTHAGANRRFEGYLMLIESGTLVSIQRHDQETAPAENGADHIECPDCGADGGHCETCNTTGRVTQAVADGLVT